jgi:hypothetical protein
MKLVSNLLLIAFISICTNGFSQDLDLNNYRFRYQKYRGFTSQFGLDNSSVQNYNTFTANAQNQNLFQNSVGINNSFNLSPSYYSLINTDALQQSSNWYLREQFNSSDGLNDDVRGGKMKSNSISNQTNLNIRQTSRFYKGQKFNYLSWTTQMHFNYFNSTGMNNPELVLEKFKNRNLGISANLQLGLGNGRLEYVSDAVLAMFIVKDLQNIGGFSIDKDQMEILAKSITFIKRQRYLDFRFALIDQLTMLDSAIEANSTYSDRDIQYFTTINDNWLYANTISRYSGKRLTYFLDVNLGVRNQRNKSELNNAVGISKTEYDIRNMFDQDYSMAAVLDYAVSKQRSLNKQTSNGFSISSGVQLLTDKTWTYSGLISFPSPKPKSIRNLDDYWINSFNAYWETLFQPNSRTYLTSKISAGILHQSKIDNLRKDQSGDDSFLLNPTINYRLDFFRWLSPHLNLRATLNVMARHTNAKFNRPGNSNIQNLTRLDHNLSAGISYQWF